MTREYFKDVSCPKCDEIMTPDIVEKKIIIEIHKEKIEVNAERAKCTNCGEEFLVENIIDGYDEAYDLYRQKHNLLSPAEIETIRKKYDLSKKAFSILLGFGEITVQRYEKGAIQDRTHDGIMRLAKNPVNMKELFEKNRGLLLAEDVKNFEIKINALANETTNEDLYNSIMKALDFPEDELNGFKKFNLDRFANLVLLILERADAWTTQIVKYLFFIDFENYARNNKSISGLRYVHQKNGPLLAEYNKLLYYLLEKGYVKKEINSMGERYSKIKDTDPTMFSVEEVELVDMILDKFGKYSPSKLSEITHELDLWIDSMKNEYISYNHAKQVFDMIEKL